jgi:CDGSH-type Zn-finger protein
MELCRGGQSAIKPFCDVTHAKVGFKAENDPSGCPTGATLMWGRVTIGRDR